VNSRRYLALTLLVGYVLAQASAWLGHDATAHACRDGHAHSHCVAGAPHDHAELPASGERLQAAARSGDHHDCAACQFHFQAQHVAGLASAFNHEDVPTFRATWVAVEPTPALHSNHLSRGPPQLA
jgi:hypothetical protein